MTEPVPDRSDSDLILASVADPAAFRELYQRHASNLLGYFFKRTFDAQVAADLMAETFAVALERRAKYRDQGQPGAVWLYGIASKELSRYRRGWAIEHRALARLGIERPVLDDEGIARVEDLTDLGAFRELLAEAVAELNGRQREALRLRVLEGLDFRSVGRILGCSEGAARVMVHRSLSRLAERMGASQ